MNCSINLASLLTFQSPHQPDKLDFTAALEKIAEAEIERDPSWLSQNRGKAASLLQGVVDRSNVYQDVEKSLERLISDNISHLEYIARDIRRADVGEEVARAEEQRGRKTEEEYEQEAAVRQQERAKIREQEEAKRKRVEEKERLMAETTRKMKELEKLRKDDQRRREKEARKAAVQKVQEERQRKHEQEREAAERLRQQERDQERERYEREREASILKEAEPTSDSPSVKLPTDEELNAAALEAILNESADLAARNTKRDADHLEEQAPPHRSGSASIPKGPAADRFKLSVKSDHTGPKLSYSSTHRGAAHLPSPLSVLARNESPFRRSSLQSERKPSISQFDGPNSSSAINRDGGPPFWGDDEARGQKPRHRDYDEDEYRSSSRRRESIRDGSRDYEHDSRDYHGSGSKHDRYSNSGGGGVSKSRETFDEHTGRPRARIDDPPQNIDRYVPGKGTVTSRPRGGDGGSRDAERGSRSSHHRSERDHARDRDRDRDRDRNHRRSDYGDRERDGRDKDRGDEYHHRRDRDRDGRDGNDSRGYRRDRDRDREKEYDRPSHRPRRDPAPEKIDRYVPDQ